MGAAAHQRGHGGGDVGLFGFDVAPFAGAARLHDQQARQAFVRDVKPACIAQKLVALHIFRQGDADPVFALAGSLGDIDLNAAVDATGGDRPSEITVFALVAADGGGLRRRIGDGGRSRVNLGCVVTTATSCCQRQGGQHHSVCAQQLAKIPACHFCRQQPAFFRRWQAMSCANLSCELFRHDVLCLLIR